MYNCRNGKIVSTRKWTHVTVMWPHFKWNDEKKQKLQKIKVYVPSMARENLTLDSCDLLSIVENSPEMTFVCLFVSLLSKRSGSNVSFVSILLQLCGHKFRKWSISHFGFCLFGWLQFFQIRCWIARSTARIFICDIPVIRRQHRLMCYFYGHEQIDSDYGDLMRRTKSRSTYQLTTYATRFYRSIVNSI